MAGEQIVERYLAQENSAEYSPIAVMQLLLVQTWKPIAPHREKPVVGWVLGTLFPDFDVRARPIKRRVTHAAIASLPIEFLPALLAGLARVVADPQVLRDLRSATIMRGKRNFDRFCQQANYERHLPTGKAINSENMLTDILIIDGKLQKTLHILIPKLAPDNRLARWRGAASLSAR